MAALKRLVVVVGSRSPVSSSVRFCRSDGSSWSELGRRMCSSTSSQGALSKEQRDEVGTILKMLSDLHLRKVDRHLLSREIGVEEAINVSMASYLTKREQGIPNKAILAEESKEYVAKQKLKSLQFFVGAFVGMGGIAIGYLCTSKKRNGYYD